MPPSPEKPVITTETPVYVDPSDLPLDTPQGDDGDDRDNDLPVEDEKP